jgi:hypothetical protein
MRMPWLPTPVPVDEYTRRDSRSPAPRLVHRCMLTRHDGDTDLYHAAELRPLL